MMRTCIAATTVALLIGQASLAQAEEPKPAEEPPADEGVSPIIFGVSGGSVLAAGYVATIVIGAVAASDADSGGGRIVGHACIPLAGPLVILGEDEVSDGFETALVLTGAAQAVGLVSGFAAVSYAGSTRKTAALTVAPTPGGAVVTGRF